MVLGTMALVVEIFRLAKVRPFALVVQGSLLWCCVASCPRCGGLLPLLCKGLCSYIVCRRAPRKVGLLPHMDEVFCPYCARVFLTTLHGMVPPAAENFYLTRVNFFALVMQGSL